MSAMAGGDGNGTTATGGSSPSADRLNPHLFRDHLLSRSNVCQELQSHSLAELRPGQLILHSTGLSLTQTQAQQLSGLARLGQEPRGRPPAGGGTFSEPPPPALPGGLALAAVQSAASSDLHEVLHEEVLNVTHVGPLPPGVPVGAMSYIQSVEEAGGDLQIVTVRTVGLRDVDVWRDLVGFDLPLTLLRVGGAVGAAAPPFTTAEDVRILWQALCPELHDKIVVQMDRRILRQARHHEVFLL